MVHRRRFPGRTRPMLALLTAALVSGCFAQLPTPPPPRSADSAAIGFQMRLYTPFWQHRTPQVVVWRRAPRNPGEQAAYYFSNLAWGPQNYVFNVPPGRFVALACALIIDVPNLGPTVFLTYFERSLMQRTVVEVAPGTLAYAGSHDVMLKSLRRKGPADADLPFGRFFDRDPGLFGRMALLLPVAVWGSVVYVGVSAESARDRNAEWAFLTKTRELLEDSGWSDRVRRRRRKLSAQ